MAVNEISFIEGAKHSVRITLPTDFWQPGYKALIQVRRSADKPVVLEFSTEDTVESGTKLLVADPYIYWTLLGSQTVGIHGSYLWQIAIYSSDDEVIIAQDYLFTVEAAIVKL